eukprot:CAMPEP_0184676568 /NCGR_PEP_ID=MMETSP0308-20130426/88420_1 /TAXON_ID=38269 /ORGANISM="Gloeochaete witrockiana, Strain SAG 46.84" /LENGTH=625 /DNA_ID=CAMNT_0027124409 /DNA_START=204 /DNA_END=2078 /DNA_ORIENTATION=+
MTSDYGNLIDKCGKEAAVYIVLHRYILILVSIYALVALLIILPVNTSETYCAGFVSTTITNLAARKTKLWTHATVAIFMTLVTWTLLFEFRRWLASTARYEAREERLSDVAERTVMLTGVSKSAGEEQVSDFLSRMYPGMLVKVTQAKMYTDLLKLKAKYDSLSLELERCQCRIAKHPEKRPVIRTGCLWIHREDAEEYLTKAFKAVESELEEKIVDPQGIPLDVYFATFSIVEASSRFVRDCTVAGGWRGALMKIFLGKDFAVVIGTHRKRKSTAIRVLKSAPWWRLGIRVEPAPHPNDIIWENLWVPRPLRILRQFVTIVIVTGIILLWNVPIAFVAEVDNLISIPVIGEALDSYIQRHPSVVPLLTYWLPALVLMTLNTLLPTIVQGLSSLEGHRTNSGQFKSVMRQMFASYIMNVIIFPSALTAIIKWIEMIIEVMSQGSTVTLEYAMRDELPAVLATIMGASGSFFLVYLINAAFIRAGLQLLQLPVLFFKVVNQLRAVTPEEKRVAQQVNPYPFWLMYSDSCLWLAICLLFGTTVPLILLAGILCFTVRKVVDKINLVFVFPRMAPTDGSMVRLCLDFILGSLVLYQCALGSYLSARNKVFLFLFLLPICTLLYRLAVW